MATLPVLMLVNLVGPATEQNMNPDVHVYKGVFQLLGLNIFRVPYFEQVYILEALISPAAYVLSQKVRHY